MTGLKFFFFLNLYIYVGPKDLGAPAHFNIKPKAQAEEENVRG